MNPTTLPFNRVWKLPPLILHPFTDSAGPERLTESSRAHLILQGLLPGKGESRDELEEKLLQGRLYEIRMLFYLGKDLERWVDQCTELAAKDTELQGAGVSDLSFFALLVDSPPPSVQEKLQVWGVIDSKAIFARAIGLRSLFEDAPSRITVTPEFVKNYYRYADHLYASRLSGAAYTALPGKQFIFELYASGEYARMLERQWEEETNET